MTSVNPWFEEDAYTNPNPNLDPKGFPGVTRVPKSYWDNYYKNNPPGGLISFPPKPEPAPWSGFDTNTIAGIVAASGGGGNTSGGGSKSGGGSPIKTAGKELDINDIILKSRTEEEKIAQLLLTDIGGRELLTFSRHDQINGVNQQYSPIKNLADVSLEYSPLRISPNADNVTTYLTTFNFNISKYIPTQQELNEIYPLAEDESKRAVVYFDKATNSLNVHVKNIFVNEKVEVEFIVPEEVKDGTIYT